MPPPNSSPTCRQAGNAHPPTLIATAVFLVLSAFAAAMVWGLPIDIMLLVTRAEVQGRVIQCGIDRSLTVNDANPWRLDYTYDVDGELLTDSRHVWNPALAAAATPRAAVTIEYVPRHPEWSRPKGEMVCAIGWLGAIITLLFPAAALGALIVVGLKGRHVI